MVLSPAVGVMPGFLSESYAFQFSLLHKLKKKKKICFCKLICNGNKRQCAPFVWSQVPVLYTKGWTARRNRWEAEERAPHTRLMVQWDLPRRSELSSWPSSELLGILCVLRVPRYVSSHTGEGGLCVSAHPSQVHLYFFTNRVSLGIEAEKHFKTKCCPK